MSVTWMMRLGVLLLAVWPSAGHAAHGSAGAFAPPAAGTTTLIMPADGVFHFTTINIPLGATVRFTPNAANTPVFLTATGNVVIDGILTVSPSQIQLGSRLGGPGGSPGGLPVGAGNGGDGAGLAPGHGGGAPGGPGGGGGLGTAGSLAIRHCNLPLAGAPGGAAPFPEPLTGGSGGGAGGGVNFFGNLFEGGFGGGGAGAVRISTPGSITVRGQVLADGAWGGTALSTGCNGPGGGGSGGVIDLQAAAITIEIGALLRARGGPGGGRSSINVNDPLFSSGANGGQGYVRLVGLENVVRGTIEGVAVIQAPPNAAPAASAGADQVVNEGSLVTLDGSSSSDPDGNALIYMWTQLGVPAVALSNPGVVKPTFTAPQVSGNGVPLVLTFQLIVSDGLLQSASDTVQIMVHNVNQNPTADAGAAQSVTEGAPVTLDGSASADPDGDALTYHWTQVGGTLVTLNLTDPARPTFLAPLQTTNAGEVLTFQLGVSDGFGGVSVPPAAVNVTVKNINTPPVAHITGPATVQEGSAVQLSGHTSYDPDSDPLTFQWTPPVGVTLDLTDPVRPRFVAPAVGAAGTMLTFGLRVDDGFGGSAIDTLDIAVSNVNRAPTANAGTPQTVIEGSPVTLNGLLSSDPDLEPLTYQWTQTSGVPAVALVGAGTGTPSFTAPAVAATTVLTFELVVGDGIDVSAPAQTTVTVLDTNRPVACGSAFPSAGLLWPPNQPLVPVTIAGVTDPDDDQVTLTVTAVTQDEPVSGVDDPGPDAVLQGAQVLLRAQRRGAGNGRVYEVSFTADDGRGGTCNGSVKVGVPKSMKPGNAPVDDGQAYDSTLP